MMSSMICEVGLVGLGVMGRNLLLNMADHGFVVAGFDIDQSKVESLRRESRASIHALDTLIEFVTQLKSPRAIILLVPAGSAVDSVIRELLPHLQQGDLIVDAGNSHFIDTDRREENLRNKGIQFLGVGISGGEEGARRGPSMMPGGSKEAYARVSSIFEAIAAKVNNDPCVAYMGNGSAGHYVKMVHNGIEYGIMQLIAESYDLMKRGLNLDNEKIAETYRSWNESELASYLIKITSHIFSTRDDMTGEYLIDKVKGVAAQTGTGQWTSQSSLELQTPIPTIDLAVSQRDLSLLWDERSQMSELYVRPMLPITRDQKAFLKQLQGALLTSLIVVYAQGMALLGVASKKYGYQLDLESVARIWRGGCIIRADLLNDICAAFGRDKHLGNLLMDVNLSKKIMNHQEDLRQVVSQAVLAGIPTPSLLTSLSYLDSLRSVWQPANLIQAQRDYFGSHRYERVDIQGVFHTKWEHF